MPNTKTAIPELPLRVLIVTAELAPYAQTGGLGEAVSALAVELRRRGTDVRVLMPRYRRIDPTPLYRHPDPLGVEVGRNELFVGLLQASHPHEPDLPVYMIERNDLFDRAGIYGEAGAVYRDNHLRFALLASSTFAVGRALRWIPDVIHANDWSSGYATTLLEKRERVRGFPDTASVMTVHNLGYDETIAAAEHHRIGITAEQSAQFGLVDETAQTMSFTRSALLNAQAVAFVSPSYAHEVLSPEFGCGYESILQQRAESLHGILNGVDYELWNPVKSRFLHYPFSVSDLSGKRENKRAVQRDLSPSGGDDPPLFAIVGRLVAQKGVHELFDPDSGILEEYLQRGKLQCVVMGEGTATVERRVAELDSRYSNFKAFPRFRRADAHRILAGADFLLMPSRYEPCGLGQMYALSYGTIPVVTHTGGLKDTITETQPDGSVGTGIFIRPAGRASVSREEIATGLDRALDLWNRGSDIVDTVRRRCMSQRFPWADAASAYETLYREVREAAALRSRRRSR